MYRLKNSGRRTNERRESVGGDGSGIEIKEEFTMVVLGYSMMSHDEIHSRCPCHGRVNRGEVQPTAGPRSGANTAAMRGLYPARLSKTPALLLGIAFTALGSYARTGA
jgi:hypothetical protein